MKAVVLGAAAGGGFPQWNCGCMNCEAVRKSAPGFLKRTQDSMAVVGEGGVVLVNASPDILVQMQQNRVLWPRTPRDTPIGAIILTNGDMDHVLGLFSMRESQPLAIYATKPVWSGIESSIFVRTLKRFEGQVVFRPLSLDRETELANAKGEPLGVKVRAFATPGKLPVHLVGHGVESPEDNIGLSFGRLAYAAACASLDGVDLGGHDTVLFDGTFFREDELVRQGLSKAVAKDMAHLPIDKSLDRIGAKQRIYTHINNTNPILDPSSEERSIVEKAGWQVAFDGMEIEA